MHAIKSILNKYVGALALGFTLLACGAGSAWAQGEEGDEGWQRPVSTEGKIEILLSSGEEGDEGWQLADTTEGKSGFLLAGGEEGDEGWQRLDYTAFSIAGSVEQPSQPALLGNYPNPFNPETTLRFEVRAAQQVRLSVFNALGQRVQVLVDGWVEAGAHEARFDGYGLPSGTYFSRLVTEAGVVTRTMVLTK